MALARRIAPGPPRRRAALAASIEPTAASNSAIIASCVGAIDFSF